ncbi:MAG: hypothetical protein ACJA0Q_000876 [Saprospiraceae bacterium]
MDIDSKKIHHYNSRYFDTQELKYYHDHHNGKRKRHKVRLRKYESSSQCFVEFKQKNIKGETIKQRSISTWKEELSSQDISFLSSIQDAVAFDELKSSLSNDFNRVTFLNKKSKERMTFDLNLNFNHSDEFDSLQNVVIGELKQEKKCASDFSSLLAKQGVRSSSFSKYCTGISLLNSGIKSNTFKSLLVKLGK